jgi:hypothetical protein
VQFALAAFSAGWLACGGAVDAAFFGVGCELLASGFAHAAHVLGALGGGLACPSLLRHG